MLLLISSKIKIDSSKINDQALKPLYQKKDSLKTMKKRRYTFLIPKIPTAYDEQVYYQEMMDFKNQILSADNQVEEFTRLAKLF
jgi:hypothetical protein